MLSVENVDLHYGAAIALRQVSLTAEVGAVTCLLGRNGVGKTSLLRAVVGAHPITSGAIACKSSCDSGERIFSGWCTGTPAASAASFTGENETCIPRPLGRSGCVTTAANSNSGCVSKCFSVGTAN